MKAGLHLVGGLLVAALLAGCGQDAGLDQHGSKVTAAQLDDQWLVINYWAQWCGPCRTEIPELNALQAQFVEGEAQVIGVNFDNLQGDALAQATEEMGIRFRVLAENPAPRFNLPTSQVLPVTHIVDKQGRLRLSLEGEQSAAGLQQTLTALQEE